MFTRTSRCYHTAKLIGELRANDTDRQPEQNGAIEDSDCTNNLPWDAHRYVISIAHSRDRGQSPPRANQDARERSHLQVAVWQLPQENTSSAVCFMLNCGEVDDLREVDKLRGIGPINDGHWVPIATLSLVHQGTEHQKCKAEQSQCDGKGRSSLDHDVVQQVLSIAKLPQVRVYELQQFEDTTDAKQSEEAEPNKVGVSRGSKHDLHPVRQYSE
mmetsp:Transcript_50524/g.110236  ORF Transcript_50524/g.110236 Transcript_50524/m.110236 type:complete len:215 (+) Transcript_50524:739-1383(+)